MLRLMGDNGKPNDNMLMHILSPYSQHRSAVTDCAKLATSAFNGRRGVMIYGYAYPDWPLEPAIKAFELLAGAQAQLGPRQRCEFEGVCHPLHTSGAVYGWEVLRSAAQ
jgi:hypothetical protein